MKIGHAAFVVSNMEKAVDFYTKALGCKRAFEMAKPETEEPWIVYLYMGDGQFVELFYADEKAAVMNRPEVGFHHLCIAVDDMDEAVKRIEVSGYALRVMPKVGCDGNTQAWIDDPDGNQVELMQLAEDSPQMKVIKEMK